MTELIKIALDPGFGSFKAAVVADGEPVTVSLPSLVGVGQTDLGLLSAGITRQKKQLPHQVVFENGQTLLAGPHVELYARPSQRLDTDRLGDSPEQRALTLTALGLLLQQLARKTGLALEESQDLALIVADGYLIRADNQDVRRHQDRIAEQAVGKRVALGLRIFLELRNLVLVGRAAFEESDVRDHAKQQRQFRGAGQIALAIDDGCARIEAAGDIGSQHVDRLRVEVLPLGDRRQGVVVRDEVVAVGAGFLEAQEMADGAEVVSVVQAACGPDTRQNDFLFARHDVVPCEVGVDDPGMEPQA